MVAAERGPRGQVRDTFHRKRAHGREIRGAGGLSETEISEAANIRVAGQLGFDDI